MTVQALEKSRCRFRFIPNVQARGDGDDGNLPEMTRGRNLQRNQIQNGTRPHVGATGQCGYKSSQCTDVKTDSIECVYRMFGKSRPGRSQTRPLKPKNNMSIYVGKVPGIKSRVLQLL